MNSRRLFSQALLFSALCGALLLLPAALTAQTGIAVTNATLAQGQFPVAPRSLATAFSVGGDFDGIPGGGGGVSATVIPLPFNLDGVVVEVDGAPAAILFAREGDNAGGVPGQINFQVPSTTSIGRVAIRVLVNGVEVATGFMNVIEASPGLFWFFDPDTQQGIISNADGTLNGPDNPASLSDGFFTAWGTGPGEFDIAVPDGDVPAAGTLPAPLLEVVCFLSVEEVTPSTALQGQFVGLWQINVPIPNASFLTGQVPLFCIVREPGTSVGIVTNTVSVYFE